MVAIGHWPLIPQKGPRTHKRRSGVIKRHGMMGGAMASMTSASFVCFGTGIGEMFFLVEKEFTAIKPRG